MVLHERIGVPIVGTWVNRPQNEFIWVRTYKDRGGDESGEVECVWHRTRRRSRHPHRSRIQTQTRFTPCAIDNRAAARIDNSPVEVEIRYFPILSTEN